MPSTGRKKDLIITAAGQNIPAPAEIETDLRYHDLIAEAVVIGEGQRYLTALLLAGPDTLKSRSDTWSARGSRSN